MRSFSFLILTFSLFANSFCLAQTPLKLKIEGKDSVETKIIDSIQYIKSFKNISGLKKETTILQEKILSTGYLDLTSTSLQKTSDSTFLSVFSLNKKYTSLHIKYDKDIFPPTIIDAISPTRTPDSFTIPINKTEVTLNLLTNHLVDTGNTFSSLSLTNINKVNHEIYATLNISKGSRRTIDKIHIKGYLKFPKSFLKYFLNIKPGKTFNKKELIIKSNNINNLPFANNLKPPEILFKQDSTQVFLYIKKQPANTFDGFLGFSNDTETNNLELNGYINLLLTNNLNFGEQLNIIYKNSGNDQQQFNAQTILPYILKTPLGLEAGLNIFKQDSTFITTEQNFNLQYTINNKLKVFSGYKTLISNNLLDTPQPSLNINDYTSSFFKTGFEHLKRQNHNLFPLKNRSKITLEFGTRKTQENKTKQTRGEILLEHIFELNPKNSIFIKNQTSAILSDNLFTNELFRIGGINSIRGFEENTINTSLHNTLNTEYRYLLSSNLFIHSIIDYSYIEDKTNNSTNNLTSLGFGLGLQTQTGLFRIIFANGKTNSQNFKFANTKIHLSLNARF